MSAARESADGFYRAAEQHVFTATRHDEASRYADAQRVYDLAIASFARGIARDALTVRRNGMMMRAGALVVRSEELRRYLNVHDGSFAWGVAAVGPAAPFYYPAFDAHARATTLDDGNARHAAVAASLYEAALTHIARGRQLDPLEEQRAMYAIKEAEISARVALLRAPAAPPPREPYLVAYDAGLEYERQGRAAAAAGAAATAIIRLYDYAAQSIIRGLSHEPQPEGVKTLFQHKAEELLDAIEQLRGDAAAGGGGGCVHAHGPLPSAPPR